ncbi:Crp/Fnr family transcriptional regulator [Coraliomargarita parva]|uniref:Crp/Fnr family transcriptional regulator n=1 Tax=Coraliomargarita parva TaxID=3014050 RepID=UPI0022B5BCA8|nr:Crp/Fnr family transcriptional regulator [Coraliomargarita parva]
MQEQLEFRPGATILKQGDESNGLYVLQKGALEVYKDQIMLNVLMYPGTVFGEIGEILGKPRTCTVKARTKSVVTRYQAENLSDFLKEHPEIGEKIMQTLANRLEITTQKLADLSTVSQRP